RGWSPSWCRPRGYSFPTPSSQVMYLRHRREFRVARAQPIAAMVPTHDRPQPNQRTVADQRLDQCVPAEGDAFAVGGGIEQQRIIIVGEARWAWRAWQVRALGPAEPVEPARIAVIHMQ